MATMKKLSHAYEGLGDSNHSIIASVANLAEMATVPAS